MMSMGLALGIFLTAFGCSVRYSSVEISITANMLPIWTLVAILRHYTSLSIFSWMNVMAYDVLRTFRAKRSRFVFHEVRVVRQIFHLWMECATNCDWICFAVANLFPQLNLSPLLRGWSLPVSQPSQFLRILDTSGWPDADCQLILFTITAKTFTMQKMRLEVYIVFRIKDHFFLHTKLFTMFGLSWLLSYITAAMKLQFIWFIVSCVNCLHGVFMFLLFIAIGVCSENPRPD